MPILPYAPTLPLLTVRRSGRASLIFVIFLVACLCPPKQRRSVRDITFLNDGVLPFRDVRCFHVHNQAHTVTAGATLPMRLWSGRESSR